MKSRARLSVLGAVFALALTGAGAGWAQDAQTVIKQREDLMKAQGKALGAIRGFTEGKTDIAAAQAAAAELVKTTSSIPDLFPKGTSNAEFPGKTRAKPDIWAQWDRFIADQRTAHSQAEALNAAVQSGDKAAITAALANGLGRDVGGRNPNPGGCGACHAAFRAPES